MIETLQPKGSVDNYICPEFSEGEFSFIKKLLKANWPVEKQTQVQKVIQYVEK